MSRAASFLIPVAVCVGAAGAGATVAGVAGLPLAPSSSSSPAADAGGTDPQSTALALADGPAGEAAGRAKPPAVPAAEPGLLTLAGSFLMLPDRNPVPVPPSLFEDTARTAEDTAVKIDVLANDVVGDAGPLAVTAVSRASHGSTKIATDSTVSYRPARDYAGHDSFSYSARGPGGTPRIAKVSVIVEPVNDPPRPGNDVLVVLEDADRTELRLLLNDIDPEGDPISVSSVWGARHGSVAEQTDRSWTYAPDPDFFGRETLSYAVEDANGQSSTGRVRIKVKTVNDPPIAVDDSLLMFEGTSDEPLPLTVNDTDVDGDRLEVTTVQGALHGTVTMGSLGSWTYTPNPDFQGVETLTYWVSDDEGGSDTATASIAVLAVNDAPVPGADSVSIEEDSGAVPLPLTGNDTDAEGDPLSVTAVWGSANGTVAESSPGSWTYTPDKDFTGVETLRYRVSDGNDGTAVGEVTVTVHPVNDAPVAVPDAYDANVGQPLDVSAAEGVLSNDSDIDGDAIFVLKDESPNVDIRPDGSFTYETSAPVAEVVQYTVTDGDLTATGTLVITATVSPDSVASLSLRSGGGAAIGADIGAAGSAR